MKSIILILVLAVVIIFKNWEIKRSYENGCMDGMFHAALAEEHPTFSVTKLASKYCFNHK